MEKTILGVGQITLGSKRPARPEGQADTPEKSSSKASGWNGGNEPFANTAQSEPSKGDIPGGNSLVLTPFPLLSHW